jgi:phosphatidylethanolamine-binding protein (PEBP) family uncharacterized protein
VRVGPKRIGVAGAWLCRAVICSLLLGLALSGCSGAEEEKPELQVEIPVLGDGFRIPQRHQCREGAVWLPVEWSRVPRETAELVLVMSISEMKRSRQAVNSSLIGHVVVGKLNPKLRRVRLGDLPSGASLHTDLPDLVCPPGSSEYGLVFTVYALPDKFHLGRRQTVDLSAIEALEESSIASGYALTLYGGYGDRAARAGSV